MMEKKPKVLVLGGGISGITAAIEASEAGAEVVLVEKEPFLGGRVAQFNKYFPKLCPPSCGLEINLRHLRKNRRVTCLTNAEVLRIKGEPGDFVVKIEQKPEYVTAACTICGACVEVCPKTRLDTHNLGMSETKAIYRPFSLAHPTRYTIDESVCPKEECAECVKTCPYDAIDLAAEKKSIEVEVNSVIVATGWKPYDPTLLDTLGWSLYPDVITNLQMERLASEEGPTHGSIQRLSDGSAPEKVAFVQCAGSRDENHLRHCSGVCCSATLKQVRYVREQHPDAEILVFYIDIRSPGRLEDFFTETKKDNNLRLIKGKVAKIESADGSKSLRVVAEDVLNGRLLREEVDLVVLATGMVPNVPKLSGTLVGDEHGFMVLEGQIPGMIPTGTVRRPVDVAESLRDATAAAMKSISLLEARQENG